MNLDTNISAEGQLKNFFSLLATPEGIIVVAVFAVLIFPLVLYFRQLKWTVLALMLWMTTLGVGGIDFAFTAQRVLIFPLEQLRYQGRALSIGLLLTLCVACLGLERGWRLRLTSSPAVAYLIFQIIMCMRLAVGGNLPRAIGGGMIFAGTFVVFAILWPRALQSWSDAIACIRAIGAVAIVFVITNLMQWLHAPDSLSAAGRFAGTTANPQQAGATIAMAFPAVFYLLVHPGRARLARLFLAATAAFMVVFLMWSGSRTGALMSVVGILVLFRARLGRFMVAGVICAFFVYLALGLFAGSDMQAERIISTQDTRTHVWAELVQDFVQNPMTGSIGEDVNIRESSYLSVAARFGIIGLIPFVAAMFLVTKTLIDLMRVRKQLDDPMIVDFICAGLLTLAAGSMFEGFLLGMITMHIFMFYVLLGLAQFLLDYAAVHHEGVLPVLEEFGEMRPAAMGMGV